MRRDRLNSPDPIDVEVGARIRARRRALRWSHTRLADAIGLSVHGADALLNAFAAIPDEQVCVEIVRTVRALARAGG
jgi:transcriptional regulator with XRE-family HTH domain